jgi:hypothetical protein
MIRRNTDNMQTIANPLTETFGHLLPLRISILTTSGPLGIEEQWKTYPATLFDEFETFLIYEVAMDWHPARVIGFPRSAGHRRSSARSSLWGTAARSRGRREIADG